jgi:tetratricopeptide (TPR) repeat protein
MGIVKKFIFAQLHFSGFQVIHTNYDLERTNMKNIAYDLYSQGEYAQAEGAYRMYLAFDPSDPDANIMLGTCLARQGKYDEAIRYFQQGIELSIDDKERAGAYFEIGSIYDKLKDYAKNDEATHCYEKGSKLEKEDEERALDHEIRADFHFDRDEWEEAIENYEAVIRLSTEQKTAGNFNNLDFVYEELKEYVRAEIGYREHFAFDPSDPGANIKLDRCLVELGITFGLKETYYEAIPYLKSTIEMSTSEEERGLAYKHLGTAYMQLKGYANAEVAFRECLAIDPSVPDVHIMLGSCLRYQEKYEEAAQCYQKAIEVSTDNEKRSLAHVQLGDVYRKLDDYVKAEIAYREALALDSSNPDVHSILGSCLRYQEKNDEAILCYQKAIKRISNKEERAWPHECLADIYFCKKEWKEAIKHYKAAIRLDDEYKTTGNVLNLGSAYEELGEYAKAEKEYLKALDIYHRLSDPNIKLANCLIVQGRNSGNLRKYAESIYFLKVAHNYCIDEDELILIYEYLETVYMQLEAYEEAEDTFRDFLLLDSLEAYPNMMLGTFLVCQERYDEGISHYQKAIDFAKKDRERITAYAKLGAAYDELKDHERAQAAYRECLALDSSYVPANLNFGTSLLHQGKSEEAIPYFEKVLECGNDDERSFASEKLKDLNAEKKKGRRNSETSSRRNVTAHIKVFDVKEYSDVEIPDFSNIHDDDTNEK